MPTPTGHTRAICAKEVIGTDVKDTTGQHMGKVEDIVLDKMSNDIMFAVVGFGGFLGVGEKYHPIPWSMLDYSAQDDSYVCAVTKDQLQAAPANTIEELTRNDGESYRDQSYQYYGVTRT